MTRVVNLRREWFDVYIGRAGKGYDGYFGNPIARGYKCSICGFVHMSASSTLPCYEQHFHYRLRDVEFRRRVLELKGRTLGCFCKPARCHGDIIAAWVDAQ